MIELKDEERTQVECYTRIMGYHRPINWANSGKQQEHRDRKFFREVVAQRYLGEISRDCYPKF